MNSIYKRRSIRKFSNREVDITHINKLVKAAMNAPSAGNEQPWEFIIITERTILDQIPMVHPYATMAKQAAAAILVCADKKRFNHGELWIQDCSAATENLLLEITESGLGGVWLGVYPREDRIKGLKELIKLPENIIPFSLVPLGYAAEDKKPNDRFDKERIHYNGW